MNINRVTIAGIAGKKALQYSTQNGKSMTKLSLATTKRYKDAECNWQERTQLHTAIAYGIIADYAAKIRTGDHVFVEGELAYRGYDRTIKTETDQCTSVASN